MLSPRIFACSDNNRSPYNVVLTTFEKTMILNFSRCIQEPELERIFLNQLIKQDIHPHIEVDGQNIYYEF